MLAGKTDQQTSTAIITSLRLLDRTTTRIGDQRQQMTDEERKQAIELHLILLVHASSCRLGADCKSRHCQKMKDIMLHVQVTARRPPTPRPPAHC